MSTATTTDLYALIRTRLQTYTHNSVTLASLGVGTRIYFDGAPDTAATPFILLRLVNDLTTSEFGDGIRSTLGIECMIFDAPRGQITRARSIADHLDGALIGYTFAAANQGVLKVTGRRRETLPKGTGDVDEDIVQIWSVYDAILWSQMVARHFT